MTYEEAFRRATYRPSHYSHAAKGVAPGEWVVYGSPLPPAKPGKRPTRPIIGQGKTRQEAAAAASKAGQASGEQGWK